MPTINIQKQEEVRYWSEKLNVTPAWLLAAIKNAGTKVENVEVWLRKNIRKARN